MHWTAAGLLLSLATSSGDLRKPQGNEYKGLHWRQEHLVPSQLNPGPSPASIVCGREIDLVLRQRLEKGDVSAEGSLVSNRYASRAFRRQVCS